MYDGVEIAGSPVAVSTIDIPLSIATNGEYTIIAKNIAGTYRNSLESTSVTVTSPTLAAPVLNTPTISEETLDVVIITITWAAIPNANSYTVYLSGVEVGTETDTDYMVTYSAESVGTYTVIANDTTLAYQDSSASNGVIVALPSS